MSLSDLVRYAKATLEASGVLQYARIKPAKGQASLGWEEDKHPRGQPENKGEFAEKSSDESSASESEAEAKPETAASESDLKSASARLEWKEKGVRSKHFKTWFGDWEQNPAEASKVVNDKGEPQETTPISGEGSKVMKEGKPVAVYHGTQKGGFTEFDKSKIKKADELLFGQGFYFTEDPEIADEYAGKASFTIAHFQSKKLAENALKIQGKNWEARYGKNHEGLTLSVKEFPGQPKDFSWGVVGQGYEKGRPELSRPLIPRDFDKLYDVVGKELSAAVDRKTHPDHIEWLTKLRAQCHWASGVEGQDSSAAKEVSRFMADQSVLPYPSEHDERLAKEMRDAIGIAIKPTPAERKQVYLNIRKPFDMDGEIDEDEANRIVAKTGIGGLHRSSANWDHLYRGPAGMSKWAGKATDVYSKIAQQQGKARANEALAAAGYDGITHIGGQIMGNKDHRVWIAFEPNQIKATDNEGTFDPMNSDIRYSRPLADTIRYAKAVLESDGIMRYARKAKPAAGQGSLSWGEEQEKQHPRAADGEWTSKGSEEKAKPEVGHDEGFSLTNKPEKSKPIEGSDKTKQGTLLSGLNALPGQMDLVPDMDKHHDNKGQKMTPEASEAQAKAIRKMLNARIDAGQRISFDATFGTSSSSVYIKGRNAATGNVVMVKIGDATDEAIDAAIAEADREMKARNKVTRARVAAEKSVNAE